METITESATIKIVYDNEAKKVHWKVDGMKGLDAMGLMVDCLVDMHSEYIEDPLRPALPTEARICLEMTGDKVAFASQPQTAQPSELQGMLVTALIGFIKRKNEPGFDPYEQILGALLLKV